MVTEQPQGGRRASDTVPAWPPPGLERIQGDLFGIAARGALAGAFLVLPLLFVVTRDAGFATLGPLADAWWVAVALATVGLAFALDAIGRTARTLQRARRGLEAGYSPATVLQVLTDARRDTGFLLAGVRHFSEVNAAERAGIARGRMLSGVALAVAGLWSVVAFSVGLMLAARGVFSPPLLEWVTIAPTVLGYLVGGVTYLWEEARVQRARKAWYAHPRGAAEVDEEVRRWHDVASAADNVASVRGGEIDGARARALSGARVGMGVLALLVTLPVLTLVPASAIGPILSAVSAPGFAGYRARAARAEAYRPYVVAGDPSVTAEEAGRILHAVTFAGSDDDPGPGERTPEPRVAEPWIPDVAGGNPFDLAPPLWGDSLFQRVPDALTVQERAFLEEVAEHPLADAFGRLARAPALDAASGRWTESFPPGLTMATLPVPQFGTLRSAANARIAAAALAFSEGRVDEAEEYLGEVLAVGFLLVDDGPTLIDNLVGYAIVESGGAALEQYYRQAGRAGDAAQLSRLRQVAERAALMTRTGETVGQEAWVRSLPDLVLDSALARGVRWEYFINLATLGPCLNVNRMVFGTGEAYEAFVQSARESLVRWPSEEPLFELARRGWVGSVDAGSKGLVETLAGLYMSTDENSCANALGQIPAQGF